MCKRAGILLTICAFIISGCAPTIPRDAFLLSPTSLEDKQTQTRLYETEDEVALLSAGIAVLQDMGYSVVETEKDVGLITASKNVDASDTAQKVTTVAVAVAVALLGGGVMSMETDKEQRINVSLVTNRSKNNKGYLARVTFQRFIWDTADRLTRAETIRIPDIYEDFFEKLSKSVFLEAYKI